MVPFVGRPNDLSFLSTLHDDIHQIHSRRNGGKHFFTPLGPPFLRHLHRHDCIRQCFPKTRHDFFYISQVNTASTGMRPPGGKSGGKAFVKELHTIRQDGTQCGAGEGVRAQTRLRLECTSMLLVRLKCRGGAWSRQPGKDPKYISHGRASGRLHYRALDTKMSSNEKARSNPPASIVAITFQTQSPFQ